MLRLTEVHFNHDTASATGDALSIRLNHLPGTTVEAPEWRDGNEPLPAAYARAKAGKIVTVKVSMHGPPNSLFRVRARDASGLSWSNASFINWLALSIVRLLRLDYSAVLGEIADSVIRLGPDGESGPIELELRGHSINRAGVGAYRVSWIWEYLEGHIWEPFARTEHKIFVLLDEPREPWSRLAPGSGVDDPTVAWVEALELACEWAAGATNQDEAAALITKRLNRNPLLFYCVPSFFVCRNSYLLSCFIRLLKLGVPFPLNCDDCASAVATFSNLLGCQLKIGNIITADKLKTRRILLIGRNPSSISDWHEVKGWGHHQVAWWRDVGADQFVFDACLRLDLSKGIATVPEPYLATKMIFAEAESRGYSDYLLASVFGLGRDGFIRDIR